MIEEVPKPKQELSQNELWGDDDPGAPKKRLRLEVEVRGLDGELLFHQCLYVDEDLLHPPNDPEITLVGVKTALDYKIDQEVKARERT